MCRSWAITTLLLLAVITVTRSQYFDILQGLQQLFQPYQQTDFSTQYNGASRNQAPHRQTNRQENKKKTSEHRNQNENRRVKKPPVNQYDYLFASTQKPNRKSTKSNSSQSNTNSRNHNSSKNQYSNILLGDYFNPTFEITTKANRINKIKTTTTTEVNYFNNVYNDGNRVTTENVFNNLNNNNNANINRPVTENVFENKNDPYNNYRRPQNNNNNGPSNVQSNNFPTGTSNSWFFPQNNQQNNNRENSNANNNKGNVNNEYSNSQKVTSNNRDPNVYTTSNNQQNNNRGNNNANNNKGNINNESSNNQRVTPSNRDPNVYTTSNNQQNNNNKHTNNFGTSTDTNGGLIHSFGSNTWSTNNRGRPDNRFPPNEYDSRVTNNNFSNSRDDTNNRGSSNFNTNRGNANVDNNNRGNPNFGSNNRGNANFDSNNRGNPNFGSNNRGNANFDSKNRGNPNFGSNNRGNANFNSNNRGNPNFGSNNRGNPNNFNVNNWGNTDFDPNGEYPNYYSTKNPLINRPGVQPAPVDAGQPPITNKPLTGGNNYLVFPRPADPGSITFTEEPEIEPEILIGPDEDDMSEIEKRRYVDIAEKMCDRYKALSVKKVVALPLVPSPDPVELNVSSCIPITVPLVIGGKVVSIRDFPHMALVGWMKTRNAGYSWKCGGSLISNQYILTAGHCTYQDKDYDVVSGPPQAVQLGSSYLDDPGALVVKISAVIRHPKYKQRRSYHDIALIKMVSKVTFSEVIRPACLGVPPPVGEPIIATGWGRTEFGGDHSLELRSVSLPVSDMEECREIWGTSLKLPNGPTPDSHVCAGEPRGGKDTCQGDSGGPAQVQEGCAWRVVGVTSVGRACGAPRTPALYARIPRPFVAKQVFAQLT